MWKILEKRLFSRRIWPDWGNTAWADMAGLGSKGLIISIRKIASDIFFSLASIFDVWRGFEVEQPSAILSCFLTLSPLYATQMAFVVASE